MAWHVHTHTRTHARTHTRPHTDTHTPTHFAFFLAACREHGSRVENTYAFCIFFGKLNWGRYEHVSYTSIPARRPSTNFRHMFRLISTACRVALERLCDVVLLGGTVYLGQARHMSKPRHLTQPVHRGWPPWFHSAAKRVPSGRPLCRDALRWLHCCRHARRPRSLHFHCFRWLCRAALWCV